jgi:hypothetical protein
MHHSIRRTVKADNLQGRLWPISLLPLRKSLLEASHVWCSLTNTKIICVKTHFAPASPERFLNLLDHPSVIEPPPVTSLGPRGLAFSIRTCYVQFCCLFARTASSHLGTLDPQKHTHLQLCPVDSFGPPLATLSIRRLDSAPHWTSSSHGWGSCKQTKPFQSPEHLGGLEELVFFDGGCLNVAEGVTTCTASHNPHRRGQNLAPKAVCSHHLDPRPNATARENRTRGCRIEPGD